MSSETDYILEGLIKAGKVTQEDLDRVSLKYSGAFRRLVGNVHTLTCTGLHNKEGGCGYYQEEELDTAWESIFHRIWSDKTKHLLESYEVSDPSAASVCLNKAGKLAENLKGMKQGPCQLTVYFLNILLSQRQETDQGSRVGVLPLFEVVDVS